MSILEDTVSEYPERPKKFSCEVIILSEIFNMIQ